MIFRKQFRRQKKFNINAKANKNTNATEINANLSQEPPMGMQCNTSSCRSSKSFHKKADKHQQQHNCKPVHFNSIINKLKEYVQIPRYQLAPVALILLLLQVPPKIFGACREEASRQCEAICSVAGNTTAIGNPGYYGSDCIIRAAVLLPGDNNHVAALYRVLPVLKVAEEQIREHQLLPRNIRFEWLPKDSKCNVEYAVINAMEGVVKNCAHVLFGPVCDFELAGVSRLVKYFHSEGVPLITVGGFTYDFEQPKTNCSNQFYMLIRTGMLSFETMAELTVSVMKRNNWTRSVLFYDREGQDNVAGEQTCFLMLSSLGRIMRKENLIFSQYALNMKITNRTEEMKREIGNKNSTMVKCPPNPKTFFDTGVQIGAKIYVLQAAKIAGSIRDDALGKLFSHLIYIYFETYVTCIA